jgi:hypothetical protein
MPETKKLKDVYEFLNYKQQQIAPKIEALLIGLTVSAAKQLLHCVGKYVEEVKII